MRRAECQGANGLGGECGGPLRQGGYGQLAGWDGFEARGLVPRWLGDWSNWVEGV